MQMQGNTGPDEEPYRATEELALINETDRLPWLEGDEEPEDATLDLGRVLAFVLIGVLIAVLILGALWWGLSDRGGKGLQAEGTTIEAPDEPYKTLPEKPGGREVAGTGDTSFRVAEGQASDGRIAPIAPVVPEEESEPATPAPVASQEPLRGVGVQVGAYSTRASAQSGWVALINRFEILQGRDHRIVEGRVDNAIVYRLQAVTADEDAADLLCESLKAEGGDCQVKR